MSTGRHWCATKGFASEIVANPGRPIDATVSYNGKWLGYTIKIRYANQVSRSYTTSWTRNHAEKFAAKRLAELIDDWEAQQALLEDVTVIVDPRDVLTHPKYQELLKQFEKYKTEEVERALTTRVPLFGEKVND